MHSSRRYRLHLERSTSFGDIGSPCNPGPSIDDDYVPTFRKKKFQPQPAIVNPSQTTSTESKDSKPANRSNARRPSQEPNERSQNCGNLLKQAAPATAGVLSRVSAANSASKDEEQHSTWPRPRVIEGIFFIRSPERELAAAKKIDDDDELGLFGEFIKKCTLCKKEFKPDKDVYMYNDHPLCKKEFKPDKDVYMYNDHPFCSSDCRDDRITFDGFSRKDFRLGKEDQKTMKSLRKDLNQLQMYL